MIVFKIFKKKILFNFFQFLKTKAKVKVNLQGKYQEFIPHLDDIIAYLKERLADAREKKVIEFRWFLF